MSKTVDIEKLGKASDEVKRLYGIPRTEDLHYAGEVPAHDLFLLVKEAISEIERLREEVWDYKHAAYEEGLHSEAMVSMSWSKFEELTTLLTTEGWDDWNAEGAFVVGEPVMSEPKNSTSIIHLTWLRGSTFNNVWCGSHPSRQETGWTYNKAEASCKECLRNSSAYELEAERNGEARADYETNYRAMFLFKR
ncbi:MAG: hypothetical protein ABIQ38_03780 [Ilumatobacteraceae bacterium]